jgi:hypothetical protein
MTRMMAGLAAVAAISGAFALIDTAEAASPPRVDAYDCRYVAATKGPANTWQTWFRGSRENLFGPDDHYTATPCFTSQASCKAWLYWAQTDWPKQNNFKPCRKGLGY